MFMQALLNIRTVSSSSPLKITPHTHTHTAVVSWARLFVFGGVFSSVGAKLVNNSHICPAKAPVRGQCALVSAAVCDGALVSTGEAAGAESARPAAAHRHWRGGPRALRGPCRAPGRCGEKASALRRCGQLVASLTRTHLLGVGLQVSDRWEVVPANVFTLRISKLGGGGDFGEWLTPVGSCWCVSAVFHAFVSFPTRLCGNRTH